MAIRFNLIVLRSFDMVKLSDFYSAFGMKFEKHRHGKGPEHFGSEDSGVVFEIYSKRDESDNTTNIRIGFEVADLNEVLEKLGSFDYRVVSEPKESPWGRRMVIDDIEGHRIELTETK